MCKKIIYLFINALVLKVCRTPGPTACLKMLSKLYARVYTVVIEGCTHHTGMTLGCEKK